MSIKANAEYLRALGGPGSGPHKGDHPFVPVGAGRVQVSGPHGKASVYKHPDSGKHITSFMKKGSSSVVHTEHETRDEAISHANNMVGR